jgi:ATP citrate (pro-S)-lyase
LQVESVTGTLSSFIVEPFLPHPSDSEYYICITSARHADTLLFTTSGGVDVGDVDAKALKLDIPVLGPFPTRAELQNTLLRDVPAHKKEVLTDFLVRLYAVYVDLHFAYLEINPLVVLDDGSIHYLDMAAKLDQTAESICGPKWAVARDLTVYETGPVATTTSSKINADRGPPMAWPAPFGRDLTKEEGT